MFPSPRVPVEVLSVRLDDSVLERELGFRMGPTVGVWTGEHRWMTPSSREKDEPLFGPFNLNLCLFKGGPALIEESGLRIDDLRELPAQRGGPRGDVLVQDPSEGAPADGSLQHEPSRSSSTGQGASTAVTTVGFPAAENLPGAHVSLAFRSAEGDRVESGIARGRWWESSYQNHIRVSRQRSVGHLLLLDDRCFIPSPSRRIYV